ncbi:hypothetical protein FOIG_07978 [Fusarium odoratissimum NRRL 54006]|uniref:DUF6604 domain-containing protein n=1 Tax=Fusarium odoratissimum (strain NRRL 54006) TaxID=1089451 RepID=X0JTR8_FUSO5|nr:uncharacterized protein FOIG_07978 [Fusarium odoratissimum NRRL 54006]EXL99831.1 hypothetical protein FOIG_07978 [Fusarium odoratissimum NRRL 54006]
MLPPAYMIGAAALDTLKKRKKSKGPSRAKNKKTQEKQDPSTKKYVIRVRDFEAMAKHVAETNAVAVPHRTAVALERGFWGVLNASGYVDSSLANIIYSSTIILSEAHRERCKKGSSLVLLTLISLRSWRKSAAISNPSWKLVFSNQMISTKRQMSRQTTPPRACLTSSASTPFSEEFLNAPNITATPTPETQYTVEEEVTWEDAFFAFTTLLRDYDYLSQEIHSLWEKYANGELDLATVALATNTAFEFAHSMEMDIKKVMDKFGGTTVFAQLCFNAACEGLGIDKERNSPGAMYNLAAYDVAKVLTLNSMGLFKSLVDHNRDAVISGSYNGAFGWYEDRLGAGGGNNTERRNRDKTALSEIFPGFHFLNTTPGQGDVEDELVRGMGAALKEKKENLGLGESVGRGYEQFKQESLKIQKALVDLPKTAERRQVLQVATRWNHDPIYETNQSMMEFGAMAHSDDNAASPFLRRNPIYCGLLIHQMRSMLHVNGVKAAAPSRGQAWEGLEEFWGYQGNQCFFVGNPSKDLEGYYKNYCLCLGTSLTHQAPNRRSAKPTKHKGNAPNMKFDGWVSLSLDNRICVDNPREPWTIATVRELLTECRKKAIMDGKGHIQEGLKQKAKEANLEAVPKSPSGLIEQLAQVVNSEIPRISFNFFTMHNIAWSLLTDLKRDLAAGVGPEFLTYVPSEDQLPFVVGYVSSTAAGHGSSDVRERSVGNDRFLNVATEAMDEFLYEGKGN